MADVIDMFGNEIKVGDYVVYTTNTRESGLSFAQVDDINTVEQENWRGEMHHVGRIRLRHANEDGTLKKATRWNSHEQKHEETSKLARPSIIDYSAHKLMVLSI